MVVNAKLVQYIFRSIAKAVRDAFPTTTVQEQGVRDTETDAIEEWIAIQPLQVPRLPTRRGTWVGRVLIQVTCFSRFAEDRVDKQSDAPWALAELVRVVLDQKDVCVKAYGDGDAVQGAVAFGDGDARYLDERALGIGRSGDQFGPSNIHAVALTYTGVMGAS